MFSNRMTQHLIVSLALHIFLVEKCNSSKLPFVRQRLFSIVQPISYERETYDTTSENENRKFIWSNQWYPVRPISYLEDIENKPIPFRILGRNLVVWKGNSTWSVMEDECPHRKAPLSTGKVVDGCNIMCRFHGWQFGSDGKCKDIPMYPLEIDEGNKKYENLMSKISVRSYPTQVAGGLLWTYLGDDVDTNGVPPKEIRSDMILDEDVARKTEFLCNKVPVSFVSMVENSFDPSHAPYIHEGSGDVRGGVYSPADALAMKKYDLVPNTTIDTSGFLLQHSPYQKRGSENTMITRQFVPPTVQKSKFPSMDVLLYFVPVDVRQTLVIGAFALPSKMPKFVPVRAVEVIKDTIHFIYMISEPTRRFYRQDMVTMRGQDTRKLIEAKFDVGTTIVDMAPTPADRGIKVFQRWLRSCTNGGPFSDSRAIVSVESLAEPKALSTYDNHGKECPRCQRTLKRAAIIEKTAGRSSTVLLLASSMLALFATASRKSLNAPVAGLIFATFLRMIESSMRKARETMHLKLEHDKIEDVYAF